MNGAAQKKPGEAPTEGPRGGEIPTPTQLCELRANLGYTQEEMSELVYTTAHSYQCWESGKRPMHPAYWELLQIKVKQLHLMAYCPACKPISNNNPNQGIQQ